MFGIIKSIMEWGFNLVGMDAWLMVVIILCIFFRIGGGKDGLSTILTFVGLLIGLYLLAWFITTLPGWLQFILTIVAIGGGIWVFKDAKS